MGRVLVVDNESTICDLLTLYFRSKGYEVYCVANGEEAIDNIEEIKPHVVLLDIIMPGIGGMEVLKEIKRREPRTGVIMITGIVDEDLAREALKLGAYDYITKPFNLDHLATVVQLKVIQLLAC